MTTLLTDKSTKDDWRKSLKQAWSNLVFDSTFVTAVNKNLQSVLHQSPGVWGLYRVAFNEIEVVEWPGGRFAYPRVSGTQISFWIPGTNGFEKSSWGIEEPALEGAKEVKAQELAGLVIPGLGFDNQGIRLGRGKGCYDRYLEKFQGLRIGVCPEKMLVEKLPFEEFDQRMNAIVTEQRVLHIAEAAGNGRL